MIPLGEASANQVAEGDGVRNGRHKEMGIEMVDHLIKVVEVWKTCDAFPAQWEGKTKDGKDVYVRYRWGNLTVQVANVTGEDRDIVEHFKKQATAPRADAYQTQINRVLRAVIEGLISDRYDINTFADMIAQKIAARISKPKARSAARGKLVASATRSRKSHKRKSV